MTRYTKFGSSGDFVIHDPNSKTLNHCQYGDICDISLDPDLQTCSIFVDKQLMQNSAEISYKIIKFLKKYHSYYKGSKFYKLFKDSCYQESVILDNCQDFYN